MLHNVSCPTRILIASVVLAGALGVASAASASTVCLDEPVVSAAPAAHASHVARAASVHPTAAAINSTRHAAHDSAVHHRRRVARTHHIETSLRPHVVTAASLPARVPARPSVPRSSHRTPATVSSHRDASTRTGGTTGLPVSAASALSLAILGTCVHQRTRDRLRSVSQPLESRGPPRAGPHTTLAARHPRGDREFTGLAAQRPPIGGSYIARVSPSPLRVPPHLGTPTPARVPLERPNPFFRGFQAAARDRARRGAHPTFPSSRCTGAHGPTWSARSRAGALR